MKLKLLILTILLLISGNVFAGGIFNVFPREIYQGDPIVIDVNKGVAVEGEIFNKKILFKKVNGSWEGLAGVDLLKKPGDYNLIIKIKDKSGQVHSFGKKIKVLKRKFIVQRFNVSKRYDTLSKKDLKRIRKEAKLIRALFKLNTPIVWKGKFVHPLGKKFYRVKGNRFGAKRIINGIPRKPHSGADYPTAKGTPVYAPNDGIVVLTGNHFFAGNSIYINHGGGLISMYFHLSKILVKKGQFVKKGEKIGEVGATGRVTGPHLHLGFYWLGNRIDPDKVLELPLK